MGELHLEVLVDRMLREFKVDANVGKPQVAYRETIKQAVEKVEERYIRQTGGRGQYGHVVIDLEPTGPGGGYEFVDKITGGMIPKEYIPSVDAGIQEAMQSGVLAGYPVVDIRATLIYGSYHDVDSLGDGVQDRRLDGFKKACRQAHPVLLEPIMAVEVVTPEDYMGDVIGNLSSRRGKVEGMEQRGNSQVIRAQVPLGRDVRVRYRPAVAHPGAGDLHACSSTRTRKSPSRSPRRSSPGSGANSSRQPAAAARGSPQPATIDKHRVQTPARRPDSHEERPLPWPSRSSSAPSPTSTSARWATSTTARRP